MLTKTIIKNKKGQSTITDSYILLKKDIFYNLSVENGRRIGSMTDENAKLFFSESVLKIANERANNVDDLIELTTMNTDSFILAEIDPFKSTNTKYYSTGNGNITIEKAEELCQSTPNSIIAGQFTNPANAQAHFDTTGPEIWEDTDGKVDLLVVSVGTGGTITGTGRFLKSKNPNLKVIAVEPSSSPFLSKGESGSHLIQGIGAGFKPEILDDSIYDEIITVTDEEAYDVTARLAKTEGIMVGISSGATAAAAFELASKPENENKVIVAIFPDTGTRYLSTLGLFGV